MSIKANDLLSYARKTAQSVGGKAAMSCGLLLLLLVLCCAFSLPAGAETGLRIDGIPATAGSGDGWTYAENALVIDSGVHTLSGTADATIRVGDGVQTVAFDGLNLTTTQLHAFKYTGYGKLTINLSGSNRIESDSYGILGSYYSYSIYDDVSTDIDIHGSGTLAVTGICCGKLKVFSGRIDVSEATELCETWTVGEVGIAAALDVQGGTITLTDCRTAIMGSYAISGGSVTIRGADTRSCYAGIECGSFVSNGGTTDIEVNSAWYANGVTCRNAVINGGTVRITVNDRVAENGFAQTLTGLNGNLDMRGGALEIHLSSPQTSHPTVGIDASSCAISGGSVLVDLDVKSFGEAISTSSTTPSFSFSQTGGTLKIKNTTGKYGYGIRAYKNSTVRISGGKCSIQVDDMADGIYVTLGDVLIDGGICEISGGTYYSSMLKYYAIYSEKSIAFSDCAVVADGKMGLAPSVDNALYFKPTGGKYALQNDGFVDYNAKLPSGYAFVVNEANSLTIAPGGSLTVEPGSSLSIYGPFVNEGSVEGDVRVYNRITAIDLPTTVSVGVGGSAILEAAFTPAGWVDKTTTWTYNGGTVTTSDGTLSITGVFPGSMVVRATAQGGAYDECTVLTKTITTPVDSIKLSADAQTVSVGGTISLSAAVSPEAPTVGALMWTSGNSSVASVSQAGVVTGVSRGTAMITAKACDGSGVMDTLEITVTQPVTGINVNAAGDASKLLIGETLALAASVEPENASDASVTWSSGDEAIATLDQSGAVTGVSKGAVTVTATANDGSNVKGSIQLEVERPVAGIALSGVQGKTSVFIGRTLQITPTVTPEDAGDKSVEWTSGNANVAIVDESGLVTGVSKGETDITATAHDGSGKSGSMHIVSLQPVQSLTLNAQVESVGAGDTFQLSCSALPENADNRSVAWSSSDDNVASVDETGLVRAKKRGTATITATARDGGGATATCEIVVWRQVDRILIDPESASVDVGKTLQLDATVEPGDASDLTVFWYSENDNVATVDQTGLVTGVSRGVIKIGAGSHFNIVYAECEIEVVQRVTGVSVTPEVLSLEAGKSGRLAASVLPADANNQTVTWKSSDEAVATVDATGNVTAVTRGQAVITATSADGGFEDTCAVSVVSFPSNLEITSDTGYMEVENGAALSLSARFSGDLMGRRVLWSSSQPKIAAVAPSDDTGAASVRGDAKNRGATVITAWIEGTSVTDSVTVYTVKSVTGVALPAEASVVVGKSIALKPLVSPADATRKAVMWRSGDETIALVDQSGVVTGVAKGTADIYAIGTNGVNGACAVNVMTPVQTLNLSAPGGTPVIDGAAVIGRGESLAIDVSVNDDAGSKAFVWSSKSKKIATVKDGVVLGVSNGITEITASAADGSGVSASLKVQVVTPGTALTLNKSDLKLARGGQFTLVPSIKPSGATLKAVTWESGDKSIAQVDGKGVVTAVSAGKTAITATTYNGISASCEVEVSVPALEIPFPNGASAIGRTLIIDLGDSLKLQTAYNGPGDAPAVAWKSSDGGKYASVKDGVVYGKKVGSASVTASAQDGSGLSASVQVRVVAPPTGISLNKSSVALLVGGNTSLGASIKPAAATIKTIQWSSGDESIARVSDQGVVFGISAGETTVTAQTYNGLKAACKVTVGEPVRKIVISAPEGAQPVDGYYLLAGKATMKFSAQADELASNRAVIWSSTSAKIASISSDGSLRGMKTGTATITATAADGSGIKASVKVRVVVPPTAVAPNKTQTDVLEGRTVALAAKVSPSTAIQVVRWSSGDESVAVVDAKGVVKGVSAGQAEITATTYNNLTARCIVTVKTPVKTIRLTVPEGTVYANGAYLLPVGKKLAVGAQVNSDADSKAVTWSGSSNKIATVRNGVVEGLKAGSVTITATAADGSGTKASMNLTITVVGKSHGSAEGGEAPGRLSTSETTGETVKRDEPFLEVALDGGAYQVDDERIAQIDKNGLVTCLKDGTVTLKGEGGEYTVAYRDGGAVKASLYEGTKLGLVMPDADGKPMSAGWESDDPQIAAVDQDGILTAIKEGTVTVTATGADGSEAKIKIVVLPLRNLREPEENAEPGASPQPGDAAPAEPVSPPEELEPEPTPPAAEPSPEPTAVQEASQEHEQPANAPDQTGTSPG